MLINNLIRYLYSSTYLAMLSLKYGAKCIYVREGSYIYPSARIRVYKQQADCIQIGKSSAIRGEIVILGHGGKCTIGSYCFVGSGTKIWSAKSIFIGNRVLISHNVNIFDNQTHPISAKRRHEEYLSIIHSGFPEINDLGEKSIFIEDDVLIGACSIILRGVKIGCGSIVGAGSVVTKDIPPWTIVAGNPARIIREIPENER